MSLKRILLTIGASLSVLVFFVAYQNLTPISLQSEMQTAKADTSSDFAAALQASESNKIESKIEAGVDQEQLDEDKIKQKRKPTSIDDNPTFIE